MTTVRRREADFRIHEDVPRTEDTEMMAESEQRTEDEQVEDEEEELGRAEAEAEAEAEESESSDEDEMIDSGVQKEMERLQDSFPGFRDKYRLIKRIGEGKDAPLILWQSKTETNALQEPFQQSTKPKMFNTTTTATNGILTRRRTSGQHRP